MNEYNTLFIINLINFNLTIILNNYLKEFILNG